MPNLSLLIIDKKNDDGTINGTLLQHKVGTTLEDAKEFAKGTEAVNSNRIEIAVVEHIATTHSGGLFINRKRL